MRNFDKFIEYYSSANFDRTKIDFIRVHRLEFIMPKLFSALFYLLISKVKQTHRHVVNMVFYAFAMEMKFVHSSGCSGIQ